MAIDPSARPRRGKQRGRVGLGLVGVGPVWERRYAPIFERFADRLVIRAIFDPVLARAQRAAMELNAELSDGLLQLFERTDIQGVLVLDPEWFGLAPAEMACLHHKPAFLAGSLGNDLAALRRLNSLSQENNVLLMTEFSRRHTPATNRIRELTATKLGGVRRITVAAHFPPENSVEVLPGQKMRTDVLIGLLDWCVYLAGRVPAVVIGTALEAQGGMRVQLGFRRGSSDANPSTAEIVIRSELPTDMESQGSPHHSVECEHGTVTTAHPMEVAWENGAGSANESLTSDRSEAEVMLDKFCRRVVGGVVPAADVLDVCRALALARATEQSLETAQPVHAPWDF